MSAELVGWNCVAVRTHGGRVGAGIHILGCYGPTYNFGQGNFFFFFGCMACRILVP